MKCISRKIHLGRYNQQPGHYGACNTAVGVYCCCQFAIVLLWHAPKWLHIDLDSLFCIFSSSVFEMWSMIHHLPIELEGNLKHWNCCEFFYNRCCLSPKGIYNNYEHGKTCFKILLLENYWNVMYKFCCAKTFELENLLPFITITNKNIFFSISYHSKN